MRDEKGILTKRTRYVADMATLLADRAERYESVIDESLDEHGVSIVYYGYNVDQTCSGTNLKRMVAQLRLELLEVGKMIGG